MPKNSLAEALNDPSLEIQRMVEMRKYDPQPTIPGSLVYGMSLGYGGTQPRNISQWIAALAGGVVPATASMIATAPIAGAAGLSGIGAMALHGGLAGLLMGGVEKADTLDERIRNMAIQGGLGAAIPAGIGKWRAHTRSKIPPVDISGPKANLPEGSFRDPGLKHTAYETGAFSRIPNTEQGYLPGMAPEVPIPETYPIGSYTKLPTNEMVTDWQTPGAPELVTPTPTAKATASVTKTGTSEQLSLPLRGMVSGDTQALAQTKGIDITHGTAGFTLTGKGGSINHFDTLDEVTRFISEQKDVPRVPVVEYGTFDKAINGWIFNADDRAALALQKAVSSGPRATVGHTLNEGIRMLGKRARFNVVTGLHTPEEVAAAQQAIVAKGYKPAAPIRVGEDLELPYADKWDALTKRAQVTYTQLRVEGPRAPQPDAISRMGLLMGMDTGEISNYMWHMADKAASDPHAYKLYVSQFGYPQMSSSPVISQVTREVQNALIQLDTRESWIYQNIRDRFLRPLSDTEAAHVTDIVEGTKKFADAPLNVQEAANAYKGLMAELAKLRGLPEWQNYVTHATDMDALWGTIRKSVLKDGAWGKRTNLSAGDLDTLRLYAAQHNGTWDTLPQHVRNFVKAKAMNWDVSDWSKLPASIRNELPEAVFNRYLIPRVNGVEIPYEKNITKLFDKYVPTMLRDIEISPVLERIKPIIDKLPGGDNPFSERRYLESYVNRVALNKTGDLQRGLRDATQDAGRALGVGITNGGMLNDMITLYRGAQYRGLIGIDSALRHFNKTINVVAENGKYMGYAFKHLPDIMLRRGTPQIPGVTKLHGADITETLNRPGRGTVMEKAMRVSNVASSMSLYPMQLVENTMRGFSWHAGLEEAANMGMDTKTAIRYAMGKASKMLPNLELTEAQHKAMLNVMKTDFGYDISQAPPLFNNPMVRLSTLFLTYPLREMEFLSKGIGSSLNGFFTMAESGGYKEAIRTAESAKLMRYLASTGFLFGASFYAAKLGVDMSNFFGAHMMHFSFPFWHGAMNTYSALMGETPMSRERARSELKEALLATAIPQYRMLKKSNDAFDAVRRGYATDMGGNYVHPSSPFGEFMNFLGVPPEEYKRGKNLAKEWTQVAHDYNYEKHAAIDSLIKEGNSQGIQEFTTKWGRPITPQDIQKVMQTAQQTPLERATKTIPPEVIKQLAGERPYLFNR